MKNEKCTLYNLDFGEKTEKCNIWDRNPAYQEYDEKTDKGGEGVGQEI